MTTTTTTPGGVIQEDLWNADQSWNYTRVTKWFDGTKIRVQIRRNAYDSQSFGRAEVWTPEGWKQVINSPVTALHVGQSRPGGGKMVSYTMRDDRAKAAYLPLFQEDANTLESQARLVVE